MKHTVNPIDTVQESHFYSDKQSELKEIVIPSSYIIALAKEKEALKARKNEFYPSLKDLLKSDSKDHIDPSVLNKSLNFLLRGQIYCIEDMKGNLQFLKFINKKNIKENLGSKSLKQKNYLNLNQIPIYTIVTKDDSYLTFKIFKRQQYVLGFLDFEDAFTYLNEFKQNRILKDKKGNSFKKFSNLRNEQSIKITVSNLEDFYKMWAVGKVKVTLIPGDEGFGKKVYVTKNPFYKSEVTKIFLASFSKFALNKILDEANIKNKKFFEFETNRFFDLFNQNFQTEGEFYYFISHQNSNAQILLSEKELKDLTKNYLPEFPVNNSISKLSLASASIVPVTFLPFLPNSIRTSFYSTIKNWFEETQSNVEKREIRRSRKKRRRKYIRNRFLIRRRTRRYFRKNNAYKMLEDRDKHFLSSHKIKRIDNYENSILNHQKKWLRGLFEKTPSRSYSGPFKRKPKTFNPDTWRLLKYLKQEKTLPCEQKVFRIPRKRRLTSKKIWRLRQLFFKKLITQKHSDYPSILKKTKYLIENPNTYSLKKDISIGEFLEKFKVLELQQKKNSGEANSALAESFLFKK